MRVELEVEHVESTEHRAVGDGGVVVLDDTDVDGAQELGGNHGRAVLVEADKRGVEAAHEREERAVAELGALVVDRDRVAGGRGHLRDVERGEERDGERGVRRGALDEEGLRERERAARVDAGLELAVPSSVLADGGVEPAGLALLDRHDRRGGLDAVGPVERGERARVRGAADALDGLREVDERAGVGEGEGVVARLGDRRVGGVERGGEERDVAHLVVADLDDAVADPLGEVLALERIGAELVERFGVQGNLGVLERERELHDRSICRSILISIDFMRRKRKTAYR